MKRYKPYLLMLLSNLAVAGILVLAYSPGFLNLRLSDFSIFRAGMSVITAPVCILAIVLIDRHLLMPKKERILIDHKSITLEDVKNAMHNCQLQNSGAVRILSDIQDQIERMQSTVRQAEDAINDRFEPGSYTHDKYASIIQESFIQMLASILTSIKQLSLYDENAYKKLVKTYKEDEILDDIQESQIRIMETLRDRIKKNIGVNEHLILQIKHLTMDLVSSDKETTESEDMINEIQNLTRELKYYE